MSRTVYFGIDKEQLKNGFYEFKAYSCGYSCGETTIFLYKNYVYLYNDECESYKYNKPYDQCTNKELEKFVNSTIDEGSEFTWDDFTTKEQWDRDYKEGAHWYNFDEKIERLAENHSFEDFEPFVKKPRIKYKSFLVRDSSDYEAVYFVVKLEDEKYWQEAKEYMWKKREEDATYDFMDDQSIMEEYWQKNNINYQIIDLPDNELYL